MYAIRSYYAFDISEYAKVDSSEILYREIRTIQLNEPGPKGIAVSTDGIFIAAAGLVYQLNEHGELLNQFGIDSMVTCINISPEEEIWLGLKNKVAAYRITSYNVCYTKLLRT